MPPRTGQTTSYRTDDDGALELASRSRGTPRIANRLLRRVRDFAEVKGSGVINQEVTDFALKQLEVDQVGLDQMDKRILLTLIEEFDGGPVGLGTLAVAVSEPHTARGESIQAFPFSGYWLDLGRPDDYDRANREIGKIFPEEVV